MVIKLQYIFNPQRRVVVVGRSVCFSVPTKRGYVGIYVQRALGTARVWSGVVQEQHVYGGGLKLYTAIATYIHVYMAAV